MNNTVKVIFKVTEIIDARKSGAILKLGGEYIGVLNTKRNIIYWEDTGSGQEWVFWVGDTCEIVKYL